VRFLGWIRRVFFVLIVLALLIPVAFACGVDGYAPAEDKTFQEPKESAKAVLNAAGASACDERMFCLSGNFLTERFLRKKSMESVVVKPGPVVAMKDPAGVLLKFAIDPPVVLLLLTQIAVRK
jgi:hypothetical protein